MISPYRKCLLTLPETPARLPACGSFYFRYAPIKHPWRLAIATTKQLLATVPNTCRRPSLCGRPVVNLRLANLLLAFRKLPAHGICRSGRLLIGPWCWATRGPFFSNGRAHLAPEGYVTSQCYVALRRLKIMGGAAVYALTRPPSVPSGSPRFRARWKASAGRGAGLFAGSLPQRH